MKEIPKFSPARAAAFLQYAMRAKIPLILHGSPGTAKSSIVRQSLDGVSFAASDAQEQCSYLREPKFWDYRLTERDAVDVRGAIVADYEREITRVFRPEELPSPGECGVLLLDEISSAHPQVQTVAYKILNDHRVGDYDIPEEVYVCGATNLSTDKAVVHSMSSAIRNRVLHILIEPDAKSWTDWGRKNGIAPEVTAWIMAREEMLYTFDPKKDEYAFGTYRSWEFVSRMVGLFRGEKVDDEMELDAYRSAVGNLGFEFKAFIDLLRVNPPSPRLAVDDPDNAPVQFKNDKGRDEPSLAYFYILAVSKLASVKNFESFTRYYERLKEAGMATFATIMFKEAVEKTPALKETKLYTEFLLSNTDIFLD